MTKPKEITMKQWLAEEAERRNLTIAAIRGQLQRGKYPDLKVRRVNARVVWVTV